MYQIKGVISLLNLFINLPDFLTPLKDLKNSNANNEKESECLRNRF